MACRSASRTSTMSPACRPRWARSPSAIAFRKRSAAMVERLLAAGAIILGKTNTPGVRPQGHHRQSPLRADEHAVGDRLQRRRLFRRQCRGGRRRHGGDRAGHRWRRLGTHPGLLQRDRRLQAIVRPHPVGDPARRFLVGLPARPHRPADAHRRRRGADDAGRWPDRTRAIRYSLADDGVDYVGGGRPRASDRSGSPISPRLGDFPVDPERRRRSSMTRSTAIRRHGVAVDEVELDFKADHNELAALWVRTISVHYGGDRRALEARGHRPPRRSCRRADARISAQCSRSAQRVTAVEHALDDFLRTRRVRWRRGRARPL